MYADMPTASPAMARNRARTAQPAVLAGAYKRFGRGTSISTWAVSAAASLLGIAPLVSIAARAAEGARARAQGSHEGS